MYNLIHTAHHIKHAETLFSVQRAELRNSRVYYYTFNIN